ncbi:MAG: glycosyltransferase [Candidatus Scalindua sp.]|nr:glycosyltransferase [Candidatus Scalindua sp.]
MKTKKRKSEIRNQKSTICNSSISLCMIVKNEKENLPRCLNSIKDYVDEIIIVDTGSTDRTVEIANDFGAKVFIHPWEGDFSKARNYSLKYATCDWILILDADHELEKADAHKLSETVKDKEANYIFFRVYDTYKESKNLAVYDFGLLFRNHLGFHYCGIVHNALISTGAIIKKSNIRIYHHGYNLSEEKMDEKFSRTSTLLKKQIETDPQNPVPHMYLGVSNMDRRMYDDAIANSKRAISLSEGNGFNKNDFLVSYYIVSAAYFEMKEFKESEIYALKSVELDSSYLDGYCLLAFAYYNLKEYDKFIEASEKYMNIFNNITNSDTPEKKSPLPQLNENDEAETGSPLTVVYHTIGHKWKIHLLRGVSYLSNNQNEFGNSEVDKAISESTDMEDTLMLLGNFYYENNNFDKAEDTYRKLLDINKNAVNALFNLGHIRFQKGDMNETLSFWQKSVELEPTLIDIRLLICKINITLRNFEDVVVDCDQLLQALNMPRATTIESLNDLANIFNSISNNLKEGDDEQSAETAYRICEDLNRLETIDTSCASI